MPEDLDANDVTADIEVQDHPRRYLLGFSNRRVLYREIESVCRVIYAEFHRGSLTDPPEYAVAMRTGRTSGSKTSRSRLPPNSSTMLIVACVGSDRPSRT